MSKAKKHVSGGRRDDPKTPPARKTIPHQAINPRSEALEPALRKLGAEVDSMGQVIGLTVSRLIRTLTIASIGLPNMELDMGDVQLTVNDEIISVTVRHPNADRSNVDANYADEEERLYDYGD